MKIIIALFFFCVTRVGAQNPVVVELFTSQGCSSCPAADKNLSEIIEATEQKNESVIGLSFHVDYWNYIGWKDPYSKKEFTDRQHHYASVMNSESVYTPQMIVNGRFEFVGSDKRTAIEQIAEAAGSKMNYQVTITEIKNNGSRLTLKYSLDKSPIDEIINVALVERSVANDVKRGENAGRKLTHRNVVRSFYSTKAQKESAVEIDFPANLSPSSIVIYTQDWQWKVTGAAMKATPK